MPSLLEVAEINPRFDRALIGALDEQVSFVPMACVSETLGAITSEEVRPLSDVLKGFTTFRDRDVLVAKITPCFENGKIAHARIKQRLGFGSTEFHVIRPDAEKLDDRYLFHFLRQQSIREEGAKRMTGSAGQRRVPKAFLETLDVPLPPLPEQRRLAAILDKADALRARRRLAIAKLDQLLQSVFLEIFGDPVTNPKQWQTSTIGAECAVGSGSTPSRTVDQYFSGDIPWVKSTEVDWGTITNTSERISQEGQRAARLKMYAPGTIVVALYGQGKTRGKCAVLGIPATMNQACAGVLPGESINGLFLFHYLKLSYLTLRGESRGGNQENLNLEILKSFGLPMPPIEMQIRFAELASVLARRQAEQSIADLKLDRLFASAQSRAFSGGP